MKLYFDEEKLKAHFEAIPKPLRGKELERFKQWALDKGFKGTGHSGIDEHGEFVEMSVRPGTSVQQVHDFMNDAGMCAVTLQSEDVEPMFGKNILTLALKKTLEIKNPRDVGTELLTADELGDTVSRLRRDLTNGATGLENILPGDEQAQEAWIEEDLRRAGYLTDQEIRATNDWQDVDHIGLGIGDHSNRFTDEQLADMLPDTEPDEWGDR